MKQLSEFEQRTANFVGKDMFRKESFFVTDVNDLALLLGRPSVYSSVEWARLLPVGDRSCLLALNCKKWKDMGPALSQQVKEKCMGWLGLTMESLTPPVEEVYRPSAWSRKPVYSDAPRLKG